MYSDKFVAVLRHAHTNEQFREVDGAALIPLGTEYCIQLKNLNSRTAVVKITIDGTDVLNGQGIIVEPNESADVQGYLDRSGKITHRFKFIEKTAQISKHRGDKPDDGMIRIEYQFEAAKPEKVYHTHVHHDHYHGWGYWNPNPWGRPIWISSSAPTLGGTTYSCDSIPISTTRRDFSGDKGAMGGGMGGHEGTPVMDFDDSDGGRQPMNFNASVAPQSFSKGIGGQSVGGDSARQKQSNPMRGCSLRERETKTSGGIVLPDRDSKSLKDGITVKGGSSDQKFVYGSVGRLEENKHVMVLNIRGFSPTTGEVIVTPIEVKKKLTCETCGRNCKSNMKFCPECGTALY